MAVARRSERGTSLVEVVVAASLFAFLVLALSSSLLTTRRASDGSNFAAVASTLAIDKIEELRSLDPVIDRVPGVNRGLYQASLAAGTHTDALNPLNANGSAGGIYNRRWVVTDNTPIPSMKRVDVQVTWNDQTGTHTVSLVTVMLE